MKALLIALTLSGCTMFTEPKYSMVQDASEVLRDLPRDMRQSIQSLNTPEMDRIIREAQK